MTYCCPLTISSNDRDFARHPVSLVVIIAFDGFVVLIPCLFRNLSMYAIVGGSLFLIECVHSFLDDTLIVVRNHMYPSLLSFTIELGLMLDPVCKSRLNGPLTACPGMKLSSSVVLLPPFLTIFPLSQNGHLKNGVFVGRSGIPRRISLFHSESVPSNVPFVDAITQVPSFSGCRPVAVSPKFSVLYP
jgi:hypothetical protein